MAIASNRAALVTLLSVQIIVGYEWLASGITKVATGTFVSGLADELKDKSKGAAHWYLSVLNDSVIPSAHTFAVLIEVGEIVVGVAFITAAAAWLAHWSQLHERWQIRSSPLRCSLPSAGYSWQSTSTSPTAGTTHG